MRVLVCVAFVLATAYAGYAPHAYYAHHIPVINHLGVPEDTPEVQHARAAHLAAHGKAHHGGYGASYGVVHAPVYGHAVYSAGHYEIPQISPQGVPLDTHEVAAAKAAHFQAFHEAASRNGVLVGPVDTPEVQLAKAAHFAAHAQASHGHGGHHYYRKRRSAAYGPFVGSYHVPVIGHNGVPVDTPEVQHARAEHFALFSKAAAEAAAKPDYGHYDGGAHGGAHGGAVAAPAYAPAHYGPAHYAGDHQPKWHGPIHVPVLNHLGVPVDTPEVQHARASHFADFSKAAAESHAHPDYSGHAYAAGHY